jgi:hypothetical protein
VENKHAEHLVKACDRATVGKVVRRAVTAARLAIEHASADSILTVEDTCRCGSQSSRGHRCDGRIGVVITVCLLLTDFYYESFSRLSRSEA